MSQIDGTFENDDVRKDMTSTSKSERDTAAKQNDPASIAEVAEEEGVDEDQVDVLPGTGGPDDYGDTEVNPDELNLSGDSIPGHPKPGSGD